MIVDYAVAFQVIFRTLYQTHNNGAKLIGALAALERGDGFPIYNISMRRDMDDLMTCSCGSEPVPFTAPYDRLVAIACGDVEDRKETLDDLRVAYDEMAQTSMFAEVWPERAFCAYVFVTHSRKGSQQLIVLRKWMENQRQGEIQRYSSL